MIKLKSVTYGDIFNLALFHYRVWVYTGMYEINNSWLGSFGVFAGLAVMTTEK